MAQFKDYFSSLSGAYQRHRPTYPEELYAYLAGLTESHELAWDCGTGNGQAAVGLAKYFERVYATDPSAQQVQNAVPHFRITYKVEQAEHCRLEDRSADLVTVAQALHWFDLEAFYAEVKRVLKENGIIAVWTYGLPMVSADMDRLIRYFHDEVLDGYWYDEHKLVVQEYSTIPFPFAELETRVIHFQMDWSLHDLLGLFNSWSGVKRFIDQKGRNPVGAVEADMVRCWGDPEDKKRITWKLTLRVGNNAPAKIERP